MNLAQWHSPGNRPARDQFREWINSLMGDVAMRVLREESPIKGVLPTMGSSPTDYSYNYGITVGYEQCLALFKAMATEVPESKEVEATFEDPHPYGR